MTNDIITKLEALGFRVEVGSNPDDGELLGRYWWTLARAGWAEVEVQRDTSPDTAGAWESALDYALAEAERGFR